MASGSRGAASLSSAGFWADSRHQKGSCDDDDEDDKKRLHHSDQEQNIQQEEVDYNNVIRLWNYRHKKFRNRRGDGDNGDQSSAQTVAANYNHLYNRQSVIVSGGKQSGAGDEGAGSSRWRRPPLSPPTRRAKKGEEDPEDDDEHDMDQLLGGEGEGDLDSLVEAASENLANLEQIIQVRRERNNKQTM
jgi:hypothetical protein